MALFTPFCKAKPPYSETAEQVPISPLTSSADCYALALVGNTEETPVYTPLGWREKQFRDEEV